MKQKYKIGAVVVVVAVAGGLAWYMHTSMVHSQTSAVVDKVQIVSTAAPVQAIKGKPVDLSLTNHQTEAVAVTIPGVDNTPQTVEAGGTIKLTPTPTAPGTYAIIEQGTKTNTDSIEGGTIPVDYEAGHIVVTKQ